MSSEEERIAELIKALDDKTIIEDVIRALGKLGEKTLPALERTFYESEDNNKKIFIIKAIAMNGKKSLLILRKMLYKEKEFWIRLAIIREFGRMGKQAEEIVPLLFKELEAKDDYYKDKIRWALIEIARESEIAARWLTEYLYRNSYEIGKIEQGAGGILNISMDELITKLKNKKITQLNDYYKTISRHFREEAIPYLLPLLDDKDQEIRFRAIIALRVLNEKAEKAIPDLRNTMEKERVDELKFEIALTLLMIGGLDESLLKWFERARDNDILEVDQEWKFKWEIVKQKKKAIKE